MKILFDHQVFAWQRAGGISRYFAEVIAGLRRSGEQAFLPQNFYSENFYLPEILGETRRSFSNFEFKGKKIFQNWQGRRASLRAISERRPDVFHPTYFDAYFLKTVEKQRVPFVLTVHDMIHELAGHGSPSRLSIDRFVFKNKKILCERAAAIVAVSENTRHDLLKFYPELDPEKVKVVWHGNSLRPNFDAKNRLELPDEFVLFVGSRGGYKNFDGFVEGIAPVLKNRAARQAVFAGGGSFSKNELEKLAAAKILEQVQIFSQPSDAELSEIYRRAACFVFPSKYEGFGIPILESFACGCPVVLNRASSLPEIGGDAAAYFSDDAPNSLSEILEKLLISNDLRQNLRQRGFERLRLFDWEKSVAAHLKIYQSLQ